MTSFAVEPFETAIDLETIRRMTLIGADVLVDYPHLISLARLRYREGTLFELAWCPKSTDVDDFNMVEPFLPQRALRLGARRSDGLGCSCNDEITYSYWLFE
ncbi:hypothetical protein [Streptomyces sp. DH10]|uniref:hypothetical protein n=1 Tax=Streptomyces sp. DH10 TaxID=3040121 RepID=UPI00244223FB|nr:hypothetical protein [Streptomyces sp. DH10]MDG9711123.1 hypothetical protein [Streptomyces sp. DH10]